MINRLLPYSLAIYCVAFFALMLVTIAVRAEALDPLQEYRYCGPPTRDASGVITRSSAVLRAFQRIHPCPSTGLIAGPCPGWARNHVIPRACGGCDAVWNLAWLPNDIKSCAGAHCVDRFERKINAATPAIADTAACASEVVP